MSVKLPVLFITHGSPMLAIEAGKTGPLLTKLGERLKKLPIKAVLVISAHWITRDNAMLTAAKNLTTIHDFGGFPKALYQLQYNAKGAPDIAKKIQSELSDEHIHVELDLIRGLDHGAWIPLQYLFPKADVPVIQLSIPWPMDAEQAINFGKCLKKLRNQGILITTSGSMTHNLYDVGYDENQPLSYIKPFVDWVKNAVKNYDLNSMAHYRKLAPYAKEAHPTDEHFLPLIIALASSDEGELITELDGGITYQALAMNNYVFGHY
ncbi:class III extradiol ring-cleavage dioxygenase [Orbus sturtevantii]|uniref:DODA-type extradiol aromatic ring-opening family dioxygenase n=1 Tax=Orbus sturtevantii TaxID=3074109 RepID=UPI00370DE124